MDRWVSSAYGNPVDGGDMMRCKRVRVDSFSYINCARNFGSPGCDAGLCAWREGSLGITRPR